MRGEGGSYACAVGDELLGGDVAGGGEVLPGGFGVVGHVSLIGTDGGALSVASIVEGEDVDAEIVEGGEGGNGVGERAVGAGKEEESGSGVAAVGCRGNPPSGELRGGGLVGAEVDEFVGSAGDRLRGGGGVHRVEDELPLALVEEVAEGEIGAEDGGEEGNADRF